MINQEQHIPCPVCNTKIPFDVMLLMKGTQFKCPNIECDASVGMAQESKAVVGEALNKLAEIKGMASTENAEVNKK